MFFGWAETWFDAFFAVYWMDYGYNMTWSGMHKYFSCVSCNTLLWLWVADHFVGWWCCAFLLRYFESCYLNFPCCVHCSLRFSMYALNYQLLNRDYTRIERVMGELDSKCFCYSHEYEHMVGSIWILDHYMCSGTNCKPQSVNTGCLQRIVFSHSISTGMEPRSQELKFKQFCKRCVQSQGSALPWRSLLTN